MNSFLIRRLLPFFIFSCISEFAVFAYQSLVNLPQIDYSFVSMIKTAGILLLTTIVGFLFMSLPYVFYLLLLPAKKQNSRTDKIITVTFFTLFVFSGLSEEISSVIFWKHYSSSFNYLTLNYIIFAHEILRNIYQSFPLAWLILGITVATALIVRFCYKYLFTALPMPSVGKKIFHCGIYLVISILSFANIDVSGSAVGANKYNAELSKEGTYSLFNSFRSRKLGFADFYNSLPPKKALQIVQKDLQDKNSAFLSPDKNLCRQIISKSFDNRANVILIILQNISSADMENKQDRLLPNLQKLADESICFKNTYAVDANHLRGIKAIMLSLPPLPTAPLAEYNDYSNISGLGTVFKNKGYDNKWIYGSYGYFNNLNSFFNADGFKVIDRTAWNYGDTTFANIWGASDEDLFNKILQEADLSYSRNVPFFTVAMNTSTHFPNTYPLDKIKERPEINNRQNSLKYTDYAIGEFIKKAQSKPWFDKTVFVFISAEGSKITDKNNIANMENYRIPFIIHAPGIFKSRTISQNISQIDLAPTLLSLLKFNYDGSFFGKNVLQNDYVPRYFALINQKLIYSKNNLAIILKPAKDYDYAGMTKINNFSVDEAIAYYQTAADWYNKLKEKEQSQP